MREPQSTDPQTGTRECPEANLAKLVAKLNECPQLYVSTIKAGITHSLAYLWFHADDVPFVSGFGVAIRGMSLFDGKLSKAGPHRFYIDESCDAESNKQWCLHSQDGAFRVVAEEVWLMDLARHQEVPE